MFVKKQVDKLIINKQEDTYIFSWYFQDKLIGEEKRQYCDPNEQPVLDNILNHKKDCCFIIDNLEVIWQQQ